MNRDAETVLKDRLAQIYDKARNFRPLAAQPPILDSAYSDPNSEEPQWLQAEHVPGISKLRDTIKKDIDAIEKFLADPRNASMPPLSTNAPYLIAVWNEVLCATPPLVSVFRSFSSTTAEQSSDTRQKFVQKQAGVKVDIIADNGKRWIRINTIKNSRILGEFREADSYLTDSEDETEEGGKPSLAAEQFDNSVLRMARSLFETSKLHPIEGTSIVPKVTLRLTRLDPNNADARIAQTIQCIQEMGVDVELGERSANEVLKFLPTPSSNVPLGDSPSSALIPTRRIVLDLSMLIALVSDLTHAPLPLSNEEATARFIPPPRYLEWKLQRFAASASAKQSGTQHSPKLTETDVDEATVDLQKHSASLTSQVLLEVRNGLIEEIHSKLRGAECSQEEADCSYVAEGSEFWTTPEARDRCMRIVAKIGGSNEIRRAHALFRESASSDSPNEPATISDDEATEAFWRGSRYPLRYIPLPTIRLLPSSELKESLTGSQDLPGRFWDENRGAFQKDLTRTCQDILSQDPVPDPRSLRPPIYTPSSALTTASSRDEIERAPVTGTNPRLTAHTVQSLLWGAAMGWTVLTANRSSVRAIVREVRAMRIRGKLEFHRWDEAGSRGGIAAIWMVDPRSLAEGMRSDGEDETRNE